MKLRQFFAKAGKAARQASQASRRIDEARDALEPGDASGEPRRGSRSEAAAGAAGQFAGSLATAGAKALARILFGVAAIVFAVHLVVGDWTENVRERNIAQLTRAVEELSMANRSLMEGGLCKDGAAP